LILSTPWKSYGFAVVVTLAAVALTRLTWPFFSVAPFAPVFGAVALSAYLGNGRAGALATVLGGIGLPVVFSAASPFRVTSLPLLIFVAIALIGSRLIGGRNRAVAALRASEAELRETLAHVRESEQRLRRAQKMEALGQLAAGVAHNFNNLLQVTLGYTDILMDSRRDGSLDEAAIAEIRRATERAASLTRQLLAFGRKHDARAVRVDMDATIGALRDMLTRVVREDTVLTIELRGGVAPVMVDPYDLEQVVFNLVINARDALTSGGTIHVSVDRATIDGDTTPADAPAPGEYVRLCVRDNGIGMSADVQAHLFEPFFTTKAVGEGTGMGLAFVHGIARHAGGFVTIDSAPGQGTTVSVFLPVAPASAETRAAVPPRPRAARPAGRQPTILLVEDESGVRDTTARILSHAGYNVIATGAPAEALDAFDRKPASIDLLLTDVVMPEMHGPELAERLLARRPELPVVFMSGYSDVMPATATATARMAFVPKPFAAAGLVSTVERLLTLVASQD